MFPERHHSFADRVAVGMAAQNMQERYKITLRISWIFVNMMCPITFVLQLTMVSARSFILTDKLCIRSVFLHWVERVMVGVHFHIFYRYQVWPLVQSGC